MIEPATPTPQPTGPERIGFTLMGGATIETANGVSRYVEKIMLSERRIKANPDGTLPQEMRANGKPIVVESNPSLPPNATDHDKANAAAIAAAYKGYEAVTVELLKALGRV